MDDNALGSYLKSLRKDHGYTQEFIASQLNVIRQTYSHYETGRITVPTEIMYALAKFYHIPVQKFLDYYMNNIDDIDSEQINYPTEAVLPKKLEDDSAVYEIKPANNQEIQLLKGFRCLDERDKADIMDFIRIKCNRKKRNAP